MGCLSLCDSNVQRCPHCRGRGKVRKENDPNELTSLISTRDSRLQPRKTKLKVLVTAIFTAILIFVAAFFLYPRPVQISFASSETLFSDTRATPFNITIRSSVRVQNNNYFAIDVSSIKFNAFYYSLTVASQASKPTWIDARSYSMVDFVVDVGHKINGNFTERVSRNCKYTPPELSEIILELSATGDATYLTQHHQLYIDDYFYINCTNTVPRPSPTPLFLLD